MTSAFDAFFFRILHHLRIQISFFLTHLCILAADFQLVWTILKSWKKFLLMYFYDQSLLSILLLPIPVRKGRDDNHFTIDHSPCFKSLSLLLFSVCVYLDGVLCMFGYWTANVCFVLLFPHCRLVLRNQCLAQKWYQVAFLWNITALGFLGSLSEVVQACFPLM